MSDQKQNKGSVESVALSELLDKLDNANMRILELEKSLRQKELQLDRVPDAIRDVINEPRLSQKFSATRIDEAIKTLTTVQRRDSWLSELSRLGASGSIFGLYPHNGNKVDPLTILIVGSGGFGDMLYLTTVVKALFDQFAGSRIFVLHEHPLAHLVFAKNPYLADILQFSESTVGEFLDVASSLDVFDLIAEVRYAVSYIAPPLSRVPPDFLRVAHSKAVYWQRYVRYDWPHMNNLFAREATARGLRKLDLVGETANLPISKGTSLQYFPEIDPGSMWLRELRETRYITVHHGADKNMGSRQGLQTKNIPVGAWVKIACELRRQGFATVQLGELHEDLIEGVDFDFRGKTSFDETAYVIKYAHLHIDTEGGLVHLARAVNTKAVVMFGPTPEAFFGYTENINISSSDCGNCWWVSRDWAINCPRGLDSPSCMEEHDPERIANIAVDSVEDEYFARANSLTLPSGESIPELVEQLIARVDSEDTLPNGNFLFYQDTKQPHLVNQLMKVISQRGPKGADDVILVPLDAFRSVHQAHEGLQILPASNGSVSLDTATCRAAVVVIDRFEPGQAFILNDLFRVIAPGGRLFLLIGGFVNEIVDQLASHKVGRKFQIDMSEIGHCDGIGNGMKLLCFDFSVAHMKARLRPSAEKKGWLAGKIKRLGQIHG